MARRTGSRLTAIAAEHGTLAALFLLCAFFSVATLSEQQGTGASGAEEVAARIADRLGGGARVLVLTRSDEEDREFGSTLRARLEATGYHVVDTVDGTPPDIRDAIERAGRDAAGLAAVACSGPTASYTFIEGFDEFFPSLAGTRVFAPDTGYWPNFLKASNLVNLLNQIAIYAILAVGMTLVIITGGIDLSVGSLVALAAVLCAVMIRDVAAGVETGLAGLVACSVLAILACGIAGLASGAMVTIFDVPPFIVTLSTMLIGSGLAFLLAKGQTISELPGSFNAFASGELIPRVPNAVILAAALYATAHVLMTRTVLGRWIYAVGGNREAARLSGVPVRRVLLLVYTACGLLAGVGGVVHASQFSAASANYGVQYELTVIAAVVVGGTSLFGGEGRILGTLVGALVLAVIFNGMNLVGLGPYPQKIVLGLVILGAAVLDTWRKR